MSKFVLKYTKGKAYKVKRSDGLIVNMNNDSFHLMWIDDNGKKITSWYWSGNNYGKRLSHVMTAKLLQIKSAMPDMILEHDMGENPLFVST